jgi:hypothetical protein
MSLEVSCAYRPEHGGKLPMLESVPDVTPLDAPAGIAVLLDEGRPLAAVASGGFDSVGPTPVDGASAMNPLGAGELSVGEPMVGELIDGGVNVAVVGVDSVGDASDDDVGVDVPTLPNGRGAGVSGAAGRGKHGACSVCTAGLGFATG